MMLLDWARAYTRGSGESPAALPQGTIRAQAEDFRVTEELGFALAAAGEHDYLYIEKTSANTEWVARQLAAFAGVPKRDVGYSGLKDRHAVTQQWFSVPRWHQPDWSDCRIPGVTILELGRHSKKLRRGVHKANHFVIVVRNIDIASHEQSVQDRITAISAGGVPNYFGAQRFGRDAGNLRLADDWAMGKRLPRHQRGLAISTMRSSVFNDALHERVLAGTWNRLFPGERANLDGSGSVFDVDELDDDIRRRCEEMDIHPTLELIGDGSAIQNPQWQRALERARVAAGLRSTRVRVSGLCLCCDNDALQLSFSLPRGAYATAVLRELVSTA